MSSTVLGAEKGKTHTITFKSKEHEDFYRKYLPKCRYQDAYHRALVYCLGIDRDTRDHVDRIYDFKNGTVKTECLHEGWQTSGSLKIVRMAFNLYCNALVAADYVLIPVEAAYLPVKGLQQLIKTIGKVHRKLNPTLSIMGILLTKVDRRTNFARDISEQSRKVYGNKIHIFSNVARRL